MLHVHMYPQLTSETFALIKPYLARKNRCKFAPSYSSKNGLFSEVHIGEGDERLPPHQHQGWHLALGIWLRAPERLCGLGIRVESRHEVSGLRVRAPAIYQQGRPGYSAIFEEVEPSLAVGSER